MTNQSASNFTPQIDQFITQNRIDELVAQARAEDLGPRPTARDITSACFIDSTRQGSASMRARSAGSLSGACLLLDIANAYDPSIKTSLQLADGADLQSGDTIAIFQGPLSSILAMERVALNFATYLSGIASATAAYVRAIKNTRAKIYDTRKTHPGLRELAKYAVACGGGKNHRMGLHDAVLVKDNHIAHIPTDQLQQTMKTAIANARAMSPTPTFVEIEVDTLDQLKQVLTCDVDLVLLDNMPSDIMQQAVALKNQLAPKIELEASGGIDMDTVLAAAESGVNRIAIGAITHSAPALDIGLDIDLNIK